MVLPLFINLGPFNTFTKLLFLEIYEMGIWQPITANQPLLPGSGGFKNNDSCNISQATVHLVFPQVWVRQPVSILSKKLNFNFSIISTFTGSLFFKKHFKKKHVNYNEDNKKWKASSTRVMIVHKQPLIKVSRN